MIKYTGIFGAALFILTTVVGGALYEGYSHIAQYISESYAYGTRYGHLMRWFGYIPCGILMGAFCFAAADRFRNNGKLASGLIGFGIFYGVFTSLVSVFPCDFGCNRDSSDASLSQTMHTLLSLFTYTLTPVSLVLAGWGSRRVPGFRPLATPSVLLGVAGFVLGSIFILNANSPVAGLLQRMTESVYLFWVVYFSVRYIKALHRPDDG